MPNPVLLAPSILSADFAAEGRFGADWLQRMWDDTTRTLAYQVGIGDGNGSTFEQANMPWQAATVFFAVIDLVAAVGLWLAAAWGGVVWLTAAISMAAIELFFPQVFGGRLWIAIPEFLAIFAYIALALMAGRERPE
jgi:hypothetical protein